MGTMVVAHVGVLLSPMGLASPMGSMAMATWACGGTSDDGVTHGTMEVAPLGVVVAPLGMVSPMGAMEVAALGMVSPKG